MRMVFLMLPIAVAKPVTCRNYVALIGSSSSVTLNFSCLAGCYSEYHPYLLLSTHNKILCPLAKVGDR